MLVDKPSEKKLFGIWREGQLRADAAAGGNASFKMEEDQASSVVFFFMARSLGLSFVTQAKRHG